MVYWFGHTLHAMYLLLFLQYLVVFPIVLHLSLHCSKILSPSYYPIKLAIHHSFLTFSLSYVKYAKVDHELLLFFSFLAFLFLFLILPLPLFVSLPISTPHVLKHLLSVYNQLHEPTFHNCDLFYHVFLILHQLAAMYNIFVHDQIYLLPLNLSYQIYLLY